MIKICICHVQQKNPSIFDQNNNNNFLCYSLTFFKPIILHFLLFDMMSNISEFYNYFILCLGSGVEHAYRQVIGLFNNDHVIKWRFSSAIVSYNFPLLERRGSNFIHQKTELFCNHTILCFGSSRVSLQQNIILVTRLGLM